MSSSDLSSILPEQIVASLFMLDLHQYGEEIVNGLQRIQSGDFDHDIIRHTISMIFNHMAKDETIIPEYIPVLKSLALEHNGARAFLKTSLSRRCPQNARDLVNNLLKEIELELGAETALEHFDEVFKPAYSPSMRIPFPSEGVEFLHIGIGLLRREWTDIRWNKISKSTMFAISPDPNARYRNLEDVSPQHFLHASRLAATTSLSDMKKFLLYFCFAKGKQLFRRNQRKDARVYLVLAEFLQAHLDDSEVMKNTKWEMYHSASMHLNTYNVNHRMAGKGNPSEQFFNNFERIVHSNQAKVQRDSLARALVELDIVSPWIVKDIINRLRNIKAESAMRKLAEGLKSQAAFMIAPQNAMDLLSRIDPKYPLEATLSQPMPTASERRLVTSGMLRFFLDGSRELLPFMVTPVTNKSKDKRLDIAFSLMVEPYLTNALDKERQIKTEIIAYLIGFSTGKVSYEYFINICGELADYMDKFVSSVDHQVKNTYGVSLSERIRLARRYFLQEVHRIESIDKKLQDIIVDFFTRINNYITAEQAKLVVDTDLELILKSDRAVLVAPATKIVLEIANTGQGIAERAILRVSSNPGQYEVDERYQELKVIEILNPKDTCQIEVLINPTVDADNTIELSVELEYDSLSEKGKLAYLDYSNHTIYLYSENQFVRIRQPYSISHPATTWFFGRQNLLDNMLDNLHPDLVHDNSLIVYGLKRAGKTSVIKRFLDIITNDVRLGNIYIPSYVDLLLDHRTKKLRDDSSFLEFIMDIILKSVRDEMTDGTYRLSVEDFRDDFAWRPYETFDFLVGEVFKEIYPRKLIIALDEFTTLYPLLVDTANESTFSETVFGFLSNYVQSTSQLTFVFTGTYIMVEMRRSPAFFDMGKICNPYLVGFLDETSAHKLITEPVRINPDDPSKGGLQYDPRVIALIIELTNCHPYLIQYICAKLVDHMNNSKYNVVNLRDIESLIEDIVTQPIHEQIFLTLWTEFSSLQRSILSLVASSAFTATQGVELGYIIEKLANGQTRNSDAEIIQACSSLKDANMLFQAGDSDSYTITVPLLQQWLNINKPFNR